MVLLSFGVVESALGKVCFQAMIDDSKEKSRLSRKSYMRKTSDAGDIFLDFPPNFRLRTRF